MAAPDTPSDKINIQGIDLQIDPNVHELCKVSNGTSTQTRSVLYVLMLASSLALTSVISTSPLTGWSDNRLQRAHRELLAACAVYEHDKTPTCEAEKLEKERAYDIQLRSHTETARTVKMPILGHAFDVNNLGLLYGATAALILLVLNFTFKREINNLQLALNAITERYHPKADVKEFEGFDQLFRNEAGENPPFADVLGAINLTRRRHHYNYLSMNEIFSSPPLSVDQRTSSAQWWHSFLGYMLVGIPLVVQILVIANDLFTKDKGDEVSTVLTNSTLFFSCLCVAIIARSTWQAVSKKKSLQRIYREFSEQAFQYKREKPSGKAEFGYDPLMLPPAAAPTPR